MAEDVVLVTLITEAVSALSPARRTAAEMLLNALGTEHTFGGPKAAAQLLNPGLSPDVLAEMDALVEGLGIESKPALSQ